MRDLVIAISQTAKAARPGFLIVPQNGIELVTAVPDDPQAPLVAPYLAAIDAVGQEDLFYGMDKDDHPSPPRETARLLAYLDRVRAAGKPVLVTDYCSTPAHVAESRRQNDAHRFHSFQAPSRELDCIPADLPATSFLYLLNADFNRRDLLVQALAATPATLLVIDPCASDGSPLTPADLVRLRHRPDGTSRRVLAYLSIGEAETYRPYWQPSWSRQPPPWLDAPNPDWPDNYKVRYWHPDWQQLLFRAPDSALAHILAAGFDGAYLDIIDAFEHFE